MAARSKKARAGSGGFSLIEVVIAMGIVATVMVALMGLLPLGLDAMRDAADITIQARISQEVVTDVQQAEWKSLQRYHDQLRYYDDQGSPLEMSTDFSMTYTARIELPTTKVELSGARANQYLRKVIVKVAYTPPGRTEVNWADNAQPKRYTAYPTIVGKLDKRDD